MVASLVDETELIRWIEVGTRALNSPVVARISVCVGLVACYLVLPRVAIQRSIVRVKVLFVGSASV